MQDWVVKLFKELCPSKEIVTLENMHRGDQPKIYLLEGTIDINEKLRANDKTPWLDKLLNSYCPAICSDSQIFCEALENLLIEQGRQGIRVDSQTVSKKEVKAFFENPQQWIKENCPEYLIYSPSAESGLDVPNENYFSEHFAFFFGQLDIDSCCQMIGRIRDVNVPRYVWCQKFIIPENNNRRPSNVEAIQADRARSLMRELHLTIENAGDLSKEQIISKLQEIHQNNLDSYTTAADTITAIRNHELANYRECLKQQLIDSGYPVEAVTLESLNNRKTLAQQEKEAKTEVKEQNSHDIYHASDRLMGQKNINLNFDANWSTRCEVMKAQLVDRLPKINKDAVWSPEFIKLIKYDQPNLIKQCELYYLLEHLDLAKQLAQEKYHKIFNRGSIAAPWKLRQDYLKVKALRDVGLWDFIQLAITNPDFTYTANSSEVKSIIEKSQKRKNRDVLGTLGKDPLKFLHKQLRSVGVEVKSRKVKQDGKTVSIYFIDLEHLLSEKRLAILQAIHLKYDPRNSHPLEWVEDSQNLPQNRPIQKTQTKTTETLDIQSTESVALDPYIYINNSNKCNQSITSQSGANSSREINTTNQIQDSFLRFPQRRSDLVRYALAHLSHGLLAIAPENGNTRVILYVRLFVAYSATKSIYSRTNSHFSSIFLWKFLK